MKRATLVIYLLVISVFLVCSRVNYPVEETRILMDTVVKISVYKSNGTYAEIKSKIDSTFTLMKQLENQVSSHIQSSDVCKANDKAGIQKTDIHRETSFIIKKSIEISKNTNGFFDITIGAVKNIWPFGKADPVPPSDSAVKRLLNLVNYNLVEVSDSSIFIKKRGMIIDLGGVAKGFIIDRAVKNLKDQGVCAGIVDAGGDLKIFGINPKNKKWKIGVVDPRKKGGIAGIIFTESGAIATSGDYERYFMYRGKRYHHILNPFNGFPANGCISVTILANNALEADAYATAVFAMGHKKGFEFIRSNPDIEGLIMYKNKGKIETLISQGLKDKYQIIESGR